MIYYKALRKRKKIIIRNYKLRSEMEEKEEKVWETVEKGEIEKEIALTQEIIESKKINY